MARRQHGPLTIEEISQGLEACVDNISISPVPGAGTGLNTSCLAEPVDPPPASEHALAARGVYDGSQPTARFRALGYG